MRRINFLAVSVLVLLLVIPAVSAGGKVVNGVNVVTSVSPGRDDFFVSVSTYQIGVLPFNFNLSGVNYLLVHGRVIPAGILIEDSLPDWMFLFYVSNRSYYVWSGNWLYYLPSFPSAAFYSNGSWYLFLYGGAPHLRINGRPLTNVSPYNTSLDSPMIFRIRNGCIKPVPVAPYSSVIHGRVELEGGKLIVSFPGGNPVTVPLDSFERYLNVTNSSALAESLAAVRLEDGSIVLYFPTLSYFPGNNTTYAGTFRGNEFIPIFKSWEPRDYVFLFRETLRVIPVLEVGVGNYTTTPLIKGAWKLRECNGTVLPSNNTTSTFTAFGSSEWNLRAFSLALIPGILIGVVIGYLFVSKRRHEQ
ncbi:hypothetical protein [Thermococcus sp. 21S7]|uniref:hypothetical protein n=1 Tax=Thermococcus sp. 21S7 TaxID=1638221 RepID=UPI00143B1D1C|nr:hypothetical protein [Thermococcus sp. 21S7]NJE61737.1 hypothetical protein [Thermococcus sp. 21S7]